MAEGTRCTPRAVIISLRVVESVVEYRDVSEREREIAEILTRVTYAISFPRAFSDVSVYHLSRELALIHETRCAANNVVRWIR